MRWRKHEINEVRRNYWRTSNHLHCQIFWLTNDDWLHGGILHFDRRSRCSFGELTHIDLDSHLNLKPDPCTGAPLIEGVITPLELPGHGAKINKN